MKRVLAYAGAIIGGAVLGAVLTLWSLASSPSRIVLEDSLWRADRWVGAVSAEPFTRAAIARDGVLALSRREARSFTLARDEDGLALEESCIYELEGETLPARWWSVMLYAPDNYLARNSDRAFSIDATRIQDDATGRWRARIAPVRGEALNWLSSRDARRGFSLTLRAYHPSGDAVQLEQALPRLTRISCADGAA